MSKDIESLINDLQRASRRAGALFADQDDRDREEEARKVLLAVIESAAPSATSAIPHDFISHQSAWRKAIAYAGERSVSEDDRSYWAHELRVFDRAHAELAAVIPTVMDEKGEPEWRARIVEGYTITRWSKWFAGSPPVGASDEWEIETRGTTLPSAPSVTSGGQCGEVCERAKLCARDLRDETPTFEQAATPLVKWLNDNLNPHASVIVTATGAELLTGTQAFRTDEFLKG